VEELNASFFKSVSQDDIHTKLFELRCQKELGKIDDQHLKEGIEKLILSCTDKDRLDHVVKVFAAWKNTGGSAEASP